MLYTVYVVHLTPIGCIICISAFLFSCYHSCNQGNKKSLLCVKLLCSLPSWTKQVTRFFPACYITPSHGYGERSFVFPLLPCSTTRSEYKSGSSKCLQGNTLFKCVSSCKNWQGVCSPHRLTLETATVRNPFYWLQYDKLTSYKCNLWTTHTHC